MPDAITVQGLTKFYGSDRGIEDVDLTVSRGEVFGFLGPNGAGKSTTIRLLLDLIRPTRGTALVLGEPAGHVATRRRIGYLPGDLALYRDLTGAQVIEHLAALRGPGGGVDATTLQERFELDTSRKVSQYSSGNRQKLGIVQAFMHRPDLLLLDEPTSGLDPLMQREFHVLVEETRSRGSTLFVSSHVLPEVERLADRVGIIRQGRLVAIKTIDELKAEARRTLTITFGVPVTTAAFLDVPGVQSAATNGADTILDIEIAGSMDAVIKAAAAYEVVSVVSHEADLESVFLTYYGEDG